jgi:ankyrin repeat protein
MGNSTSKKTSKAMLLLDPAMKGDLEKIKALVGDFLASQNSLEENLAAFVNYQDPGGNAAIHGAVFGGHLDIVEYLSANGAKLDSPNGLGCSPLWLAAAYDHEPILDFLVKKLDKDALVVPNLTGDTPLLAAASKGNAEICKKLLSYATEKGVGDELKCAANKGRDSALSVAIGAGIGEEVFDLLCDKSIVNLANTKGITPLLLSCERDFPSMVGKLINAGALVDVSDANGESILAVAAFCGSKNVVELLVKEQNHLLNKASPKSGATPLWLATRAGHMDCVRLLLDVGADASLANKDGLTPLQAAAKYKRQDMLELLTEYEQKN